MWPSPAAGGLPLSPFPVNITPKIGALGPASLSSCRLRRNDEMRAGGNRNPFNIPALFSWIPAFAGMTTRGYRDGDKPIPAPSSCRRKPE